MGATTRRSRSRSRPRAARSRSWRARSSTPRAPTACRTRSARAAFRTAADGGYVADGTRELGPFDEIVATTGFRPDLGPLRELRVKLDDILEAPPALAPLIDPNVHSCGTVPPHGVRELGHPERDFYIVGMKSYGRAPTFLMLTGYEQVRSIASALVGDMADAESVE